MEYNTASTMFRGNSVRRNPLAVGRCPGWMAKVLLGTSVWNMTVNLVVLLIVMSVHGDDVPIQLTANAVGAPSVSSWDKHVANPSAGDTYVSRNKRQVETPPSQDKGGAPEKEVTSNSTGTAAPSANKTNTSTIRQDAEENTETNNPVGVPVPVEHSSQTTADIGDQDFQGHKPVSSEAILRGFYVFIGVAVIVLVYILIKLTRLRRRRATRKYRVLSRNDDQEMFPLAADDGDDEEIYNAVEHQSHK